MCVQLQRQRRTRKLALLKSDIDSKLRACDLVSLKVRDITHGEYVANRAVGQQKKTGRPVQFEITALARDRNHECPHICTRQYARMLRTCLCDIGLDWRDYGTHWMRHCPRRKADHGC
jgi:hypothetical protein